MIYVIAYNRGAANAYFRKLVAQGCVVRPRVKGWVVDGIRHTYVEGPDQLVALSTMSTIMVVDGYRDGPTWQGLPAEAMFKFHRIRHAI